MWLAAFSSRSVSKKTVPSGPIRPSPSTSASSPSRDAPSSFAASARSASPPRSASMLHGAPALELDADPVHHRAVDLERPRRRDVTVDPQRVGRREDLLARHVRVVADAADRLEVGREPDRRRHEADRHVRPRAVESHRVEPALAQSRRHVLRACRRAPATPPRGRPRRAGTRGRSRPTAARTPRPRRGPDRRDAPSPVWEQARRSSSSSPG